MPDAEHYRTGTASPPGLVTSVRLSRAQGTTITLVLSPKREIMTQTTLIPETIRYAKIKCQVAIIRKPAQAPYICLAA